MGAAASLTAAGLPEKMSRADVQQLCDQRYTEEQFMGICDKDGFITPEQFVQQVVLEQEEECRRLYVSFCRHDTKGRNTEEMDEEHLVSFLRHCKLLSKSQFSIHDARELFHKLIEEQVVERDANNVHVVNAIDDKGEVQRHVYISYHMFRNGILPVLAAKKELAMDRVMFLLSRCEASTRMVRGELVVMDSYDPADKEDTSVERTVKLLVNEKEEEQQKEQHNEEELSKLSVEDIAKRAKATQIIQGAARTRNARKKRENFKLLRRESTRMVDDTCFCHEDYDELEEKLRLKFTAFAAKRSAEMDSKQFHRWLLGCGWYITNKTFTKGDADALFKKSMARASVLSAGMDINLSVVMNKRVRYTAFRRSVVKVLAEEINVNTNDVIFALLDVDDPPQ